MLSIFLVLGVAAFLAGAFSQPVRAVEGMSYNSDGLMALYDSKERSLRAIKDLELDYSMNKISPEEYERSRQELSLEVAGILEEINSHERH